MTVIAVKENEGLVSGALRSAKDGIAQTVSRDILSLGILLAVLQVCDGVLTGIGIAHFGIHAEGNAFLRFLMESVGYIPALVLAKSVAIGIIGALCLLAGRVRWLKTAMTGIAAIYIGAAVLPWTAIIVTKVIL